MIFNKDPNNFINPQDSHGENRSINYNTNYNTNYNKGGGKGCLIAAAIVFAFVFGFFTLLGMIGSAFSSAVGNASSEEPAVVQTEPYVEILRVEGTIQTGNYNSYGMAVGYQHQWTLDEIARLSTDELNKGIILYVNSPGGGVYESYELYSALQRYKETTGQPVYVYMAQYAASGGLMAAMAGNEIHANLMTTTGSVGVIISYLDASKLMNRLGIEEVIIASGPNKAMGSGELNDEQEHILQSTVDEYYDKFVDIVADSRSLERDKVIELADGRTYTATQALELGLIDGIADYVEFTEDMKARVEFSDCKFIEASYQDDSFFTVFFSKLGLTDAPKTKAGEVAELFRILEESEQDKITFLAK